MIARIPASWLRAVPPFIVFLVVIAGWDLAVRLGHLPRFLLPSPGVVLTAAHDNAGKLLSATAVTAMGAVCGFAGSLVLGILVAVAFSQSTAIRKGLFPYAVFLQTMPIVAVAPLIILWSGTGLRSVVIVACIVSVFPVITNATAGLTNIDSDLIDLFRLHGASRWQTLFKLRIPSAMGSIVVGAKTASGLAVIGTIVGEFFVGYGASEWFGLGYIIQQCSDQLLIDQLFCAVLMSTLLGLVVFGAVNLIAATLLRRWVQPATK